VNAIAIGGIPVQPIIEKLKDLEIKKTTLESQFHEWKIKA